MERGRTELAIEHYKRAISYFENAQDSINEADARRSLADLQRLAGQFDEEVPAYQRVLEVYRASKDNFGVVDARLGLARIYLDQPNLDPPTDNKAQALNWDAASEY